MLRRCRLNIAGVWKFGRSEVATVTDTLTDTCSYDNTLIDGDVP